MNNAYREVPLRGLVLAAIALIAVTLAVMVFFMRVDIDTWGNSTPIGLKVGELVLTEPQVQEIIAGPREGVASRTALQSLIDTLVLAEYARETGLAETESFRNRLAAFEAAAAAPLASGSANGTVDTMARLIFVLEELAELARTQAQAGLGPPDPAAVAAVLAAGTASAAEAHPVRFHTREILADTASAAHQVMRQLAAGQPFAAVSASWSSSPYAGVGGDLGWVDPSRLPPEATTALTTTPVGSTSLGWQDEAGWHLLLIEERVGLATATRLALAQAQVRQQMATAAEQELLETARRQVKVTLGPQARAILGR